MGSYHYEVWNFKSPITGYLRPGLSDTSLIYKMLKFSQTFNFQQYSQFFLFLFLQDTMVLTEIMAPGAIMITLQPMGHIRPMEKVMEHTNPTWGAMRPTNPTLLITQLLQAIIAHQVIRYIFYTKFKYLKKVILT